VTVARLRGWLWMLRKFGWHRTLGYWREGRRGLDDAGAVGRDAGGPPRHGRSRRPRAVSGAVAEFQARPDQRLRRRPQVVLAALHQADVAADQHSKIGGAQARSLAPLAQPGAHGYQLDAAAAAAGHGAGRDIWRQVHARSIPRRQVSVNPHLD